MSGEYRVTHKRVTRSKTRKPGYRDGNDPEDLEPEVFEEGDIFEPTDAELQAFSDRLEEVRYAEPPSDDEEEGEEGN